MAQLVGLKIELLLDRHGISSVPSVPRPGTPPEVLQLLGTVEEAVREMVVPLPYDAIGRGGTWRVLTRLRRAGVTVIRECIYELKERHVTTLVIGGHFTELVVDVDEQDPALAGQLVLKVLGGSLAGTHKIVRQVGDLPLLSRSNVSGSINLNMKPPPTIKAPTAEATMRLEQELVVVETMSPDAGDASAGSAK